MNKERIFKVLLEPHLSEKSTVVAEIANQVVFKVARDASKRDIKAAIEALFDVKVLAVRVVNVKGKARRTRRGVARLSDWRKAYITLAPGSEIDLMAIA